MLQSKSPGLCVLLVDDDRVVRHVLASMLTRQGLMVEEAGDGEEALTRLETYRPDVVVTDLHMPRLDGHDLCRRIKGNPDTCHIPIIVVTGSSVDDRELRAVGCTRLMSKPITPADLTAAVIELGARRPEPAGAAREPIAAGGFLREA
jgi:CheY-like chemotaxis protein